MTAPEPIDAGTTHTTLAVFAAGNDTASERGAVGAPAITAAEAAEVLDLPIEFVVLTVNR